jgi:hypothetical protein
VQRSVALVVFFKVNFANECVFLEYPSRSRFIRQLRCIGLTKGRSNFLFHIYVICDFFSFFVFNLHFFILVKGLIYNFVRSSLFLVIFLERIHGVVRSGLGKDVHVN